MKYMNLMKFFRDGGTEDIAVKELLMKMDGISRESMLEFLREIIIMSALFHKKIVRFIGVSVPPTEEFKIFLVTVCNIQYYYFFL